MDSFISALLASQKSKSRGAELRSNRRLGFVLLIGLSFNVGITSLSAQITTNWSGSNNGSWFTPGNWSTGTLPTNGSNDATYIRNGTTAVVNQSGAVSRTLYLGGSSGGNGALRIDAAGSLTVNALILGQGATQGTLTINGNSGSRGVLSASYLEESNGTSSIVLNGGVLRATSNQSNFLRSFESGDVVLNSGGGFIDTNGFNVGISTTLSGAGSLTVQGTGILTLTGTQSYQGGTYVDPGATLQVGTNSTAGSLTGATGDPGENGGSAVTAGDAATVIVGGLGTITGGTGGLQIVAEFAPAGGVAVDFLGGGGLTNAGVIRGGAGAADNTPGKGGDAVIFGGDATVINTGSILGGDGASGGFVLAEGGDALRIEGAGTVENLGANSRIIGGAGGPSIESGSLAGSGAGIALEITGGGTLTNEGLIQGGADTGGEISGLGATAVIFGGDATVINTGSILGGDGGSSSMISGADGDALRIEGVGTVENRGVNSRIIGGAGGSLPLEAGVFNGSTGIALEITGGGTLTNEGLISGGDGSPGTLFSGSGGHAVVFGAGGTVTNTGSILGGDGNPPGLLPFAGSGGNAVRMEGAGTVQNLGANSRIVGGSGGPSLEGSFLVGGGGLGLELTEGGSLVNEGLIQGGNGLAGALFSGSGGDAVVFGGGGTVTNTGSILGGNGAHAIESTFASAGGDALRIDGAGTVENLGVNSKIVGGSGSISVEGGVLGGGAGIGLQITGGGSLTNEGLIQGGNGLVLENGDMSAGTDGASGAIIGGDATVINHGDILGGDGSAPPPLPNSLLFGGRGGDGLFIDGVGTVTNSSTGRIMGGASSPGLNPAGIGLQMTGGGTLMNDGLIQGSDDNIISTFLPENVMEGHGVVLGAGGTVTNNGQIRAGDQGRGLMINGDATVTNNGLIRGGDGSFATLGGTTIIGSGGAGLIINGNGVVTNDGDILAGNTLVHTAAVGINSSGEVGLRITGLGTVVNNGTIRASDGVSHFEGEFSTGDGSGGHGVHVSGGGTITNTGEIHAGDGGSAAVVNEGVGVEGDGGHGVFLDNGGTFINSGLVQAGIGGTGTDGNGADGLGVYFSNALGELVNQSTGIINGSVVMGNFANAVQLYTGSRINGALNMSTNIETTLILDGTGTDTLSTAVTGTLTFNGTLIKEGAGRWNLTTASTRTGDNYVNEGTLALGHNTALGSGMIFMEDLTTLTSTAGARTLANDLVINGAVTLGSAGVGPMTFNGDVNLNGGNRTLISGASSSSTAVALNGVISNGGLTFAAPDGATSQTYFLVGGGESNTYTGDTIVDGTVVKFDKSNGATAVAGNLEIIGGTEQDQGHAWLAQDEQIADTAIVIVDGLLTLGDASDVTETIARLEGSGQITLNNFTTGSTLRVGEGVFSGSIVDGADAASGTALEKFGPGVLALSGASTYSGNTLVSEGGLMVSNTTGSATGSGNVSMQTGTFLGGSGFISGNVTMETGTVLTPGNDSTTGGTLTVGALDLKGDTLVEFDLGAVSDLIDINGLLSQSVDGKVHFDFFAGSGFAPGTYTLMTFDLLDSSVVLSDFETDGFEFLGWNFELRSNELLFDVFGLPYGPFIQNSAPVFTPVDADFFIADFTQTGGPTENNTVNSLTFAPGSSLQVYNQLTISSGNFTVGSGQATISGGTVFVPGEFSKLGAGALFANGNFQVAGNSFISQGALHVNGVFQTPNLFVLPGGFLGGNGLIIGDVTNSGTVGPGNSIGQLTIHGDYTQTRRGTLQIEIASLASFDRLVVSGTADLAGTLDVRNLHGPKLTYGQQYPFLQAGKIEGRFNRILIPQPSINRGRFFASGSQGILVVAPTSYTLVAQTPNQTRVAQALDKWIGIEDGDVGVVTLALDVLEEGQYPQALDAISPQVYAGAFSTAIELSVNQGQILHQQLNARRLGKRAYEESERRNRDLGQRMNSTGGKGTKGVKDVALAQAPQLAAQDNNHRWQAWMQGSGLFSDGGLSLTPNEEFESGTFLVGADYVVTENFAVGIFAGYQEGWGDYANNADTDLESVRFGLYATYDLNGFYANAAVGGGATEFNVNRPIQWASLKRTAHGDTEAMEFFTLLGGGYDFRVGNFTFGPQASIQYTRLQVDGFTERGAGSLNLRMDDMTEESLRTYLGARVAYNIYLSEQTVLIPELRVFWQHEFLQDDMSIHSRLSGGGDPGFNYMSESRDRDAIFAGAGLGLQVGSKFYANVYYNSEFGRGDEVNHTISINATVKF